MPGTLHTSDLLAVISDIEGYKENLRQAILARNIDLPSSVLLDKYPDYIKLIRDDVSIDYIENANSSQYIATGVCPHRVVAKFKYGNTPQGLDNIESSHTIYYNYYGNQSFDAQFIMGGVVNDFKNEVPTTVVGDGLIKEINYYNFYGIWNRLPFFTPEYPGSGPVSERPNLFFGNPTTRTDEPDSTWPDSGIYCTNYAMGPTISSADTIYVIDATREGNMTVNNVSYSYTSESPKSLTINNNVAWNIFRNGLETGCRIYYADFYDSSNNLIRSFRPRLTFRNGVMEPCLYDSVTDTYYFNQGTGMFIHSNYIIN